MVTSVCCFCRPPALYECPGERQLSLCWGDGGPAGLAAAQHTQHSESSAGTWGQGAEALRGVCTAGWGCHTPGRAPGGAGPTYTEGKGCASPTRATSLFGDRVMGRGGREGGREEEEGGQHSPPLVSLWLCCLLRPGASVPQFICLHMPPLSSPQKPKVSWEA